MKYIVNPFDVTTSDCTCNGSSACYHYCKTYDEDCHPYICGKCESNCISNCTSDCSGTDSVNSPSSFNF